MNDCPIHTFPAVSQLHCASPMPCRWRGNEIFEDVGELGDEDALGPENGKVSILGSKPPHSKPLFLSCMHTLFSHSMPIIFAPVNTLRLEVVLREERTLLSSCWSERFRLCKRPIGDAGICSPTWLPFTLTGLLKARRSGRHVNADQILYSALTGPSSRGFLSNKTWTIVSTCSEITIYPYDSSIIIDPQSSDSNGVIYFMKKRDHPSTPNTGPSTRTEAKIDGYMTDSTPRGPGICEIVVEAASSNTLVYTFSVNGPS